MVPHQHKDNLATPSFFNLLLEGRTVLEWPSMHLFYGAIPRRIEGENHPVLVLPPLLGTDNSTSFLRKYLRQQGFIPYKWEMGRNFLDKESIPKLSKKLAEIQEKHGQKVSVIGWSAGGLLARILANKHPLMVKQVITLASPFRNIRQGKTSVDFVYNLATGEKRCDLEEEFVQLVETHPEVPVSCIYTKTDGLVPWESCIEDPTKKNVQNIEVYGSHSGLGANPSALLLVANVLKQRLLGRPYVDLSNNWEKCFFPGFWKQDSEQKPKGGLLSRRAFSKQKALA